MAPIPAPIAYQAAEQGRVASLAEAVGVREEAFREAGVSPKAAVYLRSLPVVVVNPESQRGGGHWVPQQMYQPEGYVELLSGQPEAAVHEYAHAWFEQFPRWRRERFDEAMRRFGWEAERKRRRGIPLTRAEELAHTYRYGSGTFPGMWPSVRSWVPEPHVPYMAQHEQYAGLASGLMGRTWTLPAWIAQYYRELYRPRLGGEWAEYR